VSRVGVCGGLLLLGLATAACSVRGAPEAGLCRVREIATQPFAGSRVLAPGAAGLAYVPGDDHLWLGDGEADQLYVLERRTGTFLGRLPAHRFVEAFPEAGRCEVEGGASAPVCSYTDQLRTVLYDPDTATLYVINAARDASRGRPESRPALFVLRRRAGSENFQFQRWQKLPPGPSYRAGAVIDGRILVADGDVLVEYDAEAGRLASEPWLRSPAGPIAGIGWDGSHVWLAASGGTLVELDGETGDELARYDLASVGVRRPTGLALGPGELLIPDGWPPHPIHALRVARAPTGLVRAGWAGGWPSSCP